MNQMRSFLQGTWRYNNTAFSEAGAREPGGGIFTSMSCWADDTAQEFLRRCMWGCHPGALLEGDGNNNQLACDSLDHELGDDEG